ncbi:PREDICTED: mastermind-like domain-containing protein 1, partial [Fulmarus glacialis]|uniref:mastermind-like domain-containing protein 1 n=1 Tax=Fulmarus glacialis TaxID=30455 RepID=UPI00051C390E
LQGSIKRKLEDDSSPASSGVPDVVFPNDSKRLCLDDVNLAMGQGANPSVACPEMQSSPFSTGHSASSLGVAGHSVLLENNHMNGGGIGSPFSVPPNTEINQKGSIGGQTNNIVHYDEKGNSLQSVDQELQDLLEELTKMPDPSPNDLDLEKILCSKAEEPLGLSHSQPSISTTPKSSPQNSHLENHVANKDFSPGCNPTSGGSPQVRPSSAGANFQVPPSNKPAASPISTAAQSKNQPPPMLPVPLPNIPGSNWHAQQLKQLAASKQVSTTKQQVQAPSWPTMSPPGLSPPYRAGSSPHHQPFSPQNVMVSGMPANNLPGNNIQSPQNTLLSSMTASSTPSNGPSPPYGSEKLSSPALNQQPFSPQSSMLPTLTAASLPANNIKSPQNNLVASMASTNTGPSPPYRPEKLSSPALHQQPFSPQDSATQKMSPLTAGQGQQSLIHYLQQQQQQQQQSPAPQQSQQANNSQFLQQQFRQLIQPHRMQRHMQPATLPSQSRQDQNAGIVARLQEPGSIPSGGSVPAPATVNGYTMRNHLLKQQIMKRQLMQEKQRQNMLGVTSEQRSLFAAQQINQFQAVQQPIPADCSQVMPAPPPNHRMLPSNPAMLQSTLGSGMAPATASQSSGTPRADFTSGSLANHSATQQHLRQPSMPRIPNVYPNSSAQMWTPTAVPRMPNQSQMDASMQQFSGNTLFSKQNVRPSAPGQQFSQQAVVPPNQIAPGVQVDSTLTTRRPLSCSERVLVVLQLLAGASPGPAGRRGLRCSGAGQALPSLPGDCTLQRKVTVLVSKCPYQLAHQKIKLCPARGGEEGWGPRRSPTLLVRRRQRGRWRGEEERSQFFQQRKSAPPNNCPKQAVKPGECLNETEMPPRLQTAERGRNASEHVCGEDKAFELVELFAPPYPSSSYLKTE